MTDSLKTNDSIVKESFKSYKRIKDEYSDEQLSYIIRTIAPTLNKDEAVLFILRCEKLNIDPMSGDITAYVSLSKNKETGQKTDRKLTMIVARNWKRERGMATGEIKSLEVDAIYAKDEIETTQQLDKDGKTITQGQIKKVVRCEAWEGGKLWGATCVIVRDGFDKPFRVTVPLSEYKGWNVWDSKPETMIKKVAESQCWDLAVPELSKVYDESERFDEPTVAEKAEIKGGADDATPEQMNTIETLLKGREDAEEFRVKYLSEPLNKKQAVEVIKSLTIK